MDNHFFSTSAMEINEQPPDGFLNPNWDSALSSMVSSPAASNSNDSFAIRELIGKLGNIGSSAEISPHSRRLMGGATTFAVANGNSSTNTSSYSNSPPLNSTVAEFSADPGFAARAARFSCFGSRSFNGRTQLNLSQYRSTTPLMANGKLPRVSSSPSLKALVCPQMEESTVSEQNPIEKNKNGNEPNSRKRKSASKGKGKESATTPSSKGIEADDDSNPKRCKLNGKENGSLKPEEEPLKDYIHVRARRGQATDSHSLAERVRREKISERMKLLQDLVPGCNKVTGKALMLDEIINYVQSLQRQVECLSMKLASVNTSTDLNMASLTSKDMFQSNNSPMQQPIFSLDSSAPAFFGHQNQAMPIHGTTSVDPMDSALCRNILGLQLPQLDGFGEGTTQYQTFCEDDLQSIVQMGFGQNPTTMTQHSCLKMYKGHHQVLN